MATLKKSNSDNSWWFGITSVLVDFAKDGLTFPFMKWIYVEDTNIVLNVEFYIQRHELYC